jgi:hypothetical protein
MEFGMNAISTTSPVGLYAAPDLVAEIGTRTYSVDRWEIVFCE